MLVIPPPNSGIGRLAARPYRADCPSTLGVRESRCVHFTTALCPLHSAAQAAAQPTRTLTDEKNAEAYCGVLHHTGHAAADPGGGQLSRDVNPTKECPTEDPKHRVIAPHTCTGALERINRINPLTIAHSSAVVRFILNVNDKPQLQIRQFPKTPTPLFSFSKPQGQDAAVGGPFWDIMYPAWTFWGGGPFVSTEPQHGLGRW